LQIHYVFVNVHPALQLHDSGKSIESVCGHDREGFQTLVP
jgi:hypothetical protein